MSSANPSQNGGYALRGVRIVDFTWIHAGPSATRILSDQGAEVIKVESDQALAIVGGANPRTPRGVGHRHNWNAGKLGLALNMKTPQGVDIVKRLVSVSDAVTENFSGRVMPSWGMDYDSLRQVKPDIIMMSMSGFGRTGVWKDRVSFGETLQAWSGFTHLTGFPDTDPSGPASAYSDATAGISGAQALIMALIHRNRTGQGQLIDLAQFEALASTLDTMVLDINANPATHKVRRSGNRLPHGGGAPHGAYRCRGEDRWVAITVFTDTEWDAFTGAIGEPPWTKEDRFESVLSRQKHADDLDAMVESWTLQHTPEDVMHLLQSAGVSAGVVQSGADVSKDPQLKERGFFRYVPDSQNVQRMIEGAPYRMSRTPGGAVKGAPELGEDQTYVLREVLGMSDDEVADCAIAGAFD